MRGAMEVLESRFKETEIGLIPEHWEVVKLGEVAEISSGGSAPQGKKYFEGNSPFIRVQHLDNDNYKVKGCDYITDEAVKKYKLKLYPKDTIIFPKSGASIYLEKRAKLPFDAYIVSHLMAVRSKSRLLLQDYLFFNLVSKKLSKDKADNYPTLNISEISQIPIPLPPLEEQKGIADILSTVQNAIEKTEKVINATKQLKKSIMKHLFTYGAVAVDKIDRVKLKESEIGLIPEHWEVVKLGEVAEISSGGSAPQGKKYFEGNSPFIRVQHLDNDNYKVKGCDYITDEAVKKYKLKLYPKDTIIFPKSGASIYLEKRAKLPFDAYIVSHLMAVRSKSRLLLQDYLFFNLVSKKLSKDKADNYPTLNISEISQIPIPLPPLDEQQKNSQHSNNHRPKNPSRRKKENSIKKPI